MACKPIKTRELTMQVSNKEVYTLLHDSNIFFSYFYQGKGTVKTYWLVDFANRTPHRNRRSFRRLKGPTDQSSGLLGILDPPPSPCRLSRASSLRRTMKAIQCETPVTKGRHVIDVNDKSDDSSTLQASI